MAELMDVFDSYGDFERDPYFTFCYDSLASHLKFKTVAKVKKANMEAALETIDLASQDLVIDYKVWKTEDNKNTDASSDFVNQYLFKSTSKKLLVWVCLDRNELVASFLYDHQDTELEQWVLEKNHALRNRFGLEKRSVFKVLSRDSHSFFTEDVKTNDFECDVETMYNDDFARVHNMIETSLGKDRAGLILLHGIPGTGKLHT
jgi:hypothetical protein